MESEGVSAGELIEGDKGGKGAQIGEA